MNKYAAAEITFLDRKNGEQKAYTYPVISVVLRERDNPNNARSFIVADNGTWKEKERGEEDYYICSLCAKKILKEILESESRYDNTNNTMPVR